MAKKAQSARTTITIDTERYDRVTWSMTCPKCYNYRIIRVHRYKRDPLDSRNNTYNGTRYECGGPNGHLCWWMTGNRDAKTLYEKK